MFIANIIGNCEKSHISVDVGYLSLINFTNDFNNINDNIPTVIIGWGKVKSLYPDASILEHEIIKDKVFWIFSKEEKISNYFTDLNNFIIKIPELFVNNYKVKIIDPVFENIFNIKELFELLKSYKDYKVIDTNNTLFLLYKKQQFILDLNVFDFFNFDIKEIRTILYKNSKNYIYDKNKKIINELFDIFGSFSIFEKYSAILYYCTLVLEKAN